MNKIAGIIEQVTVDESLSLIRVKVQSLYFCVIVIDTPITCTYLIVGHPVTVIFKETEVILGTGMAHEISLQNRLPGQVSAIRQGKLLSKVIVQTEVGAITSIITTQAIRQLQIMLGSEVTAMIKTNEVMLSQ